jgi:DNA-binding transcriptional LysR family regulator
LLHFSLRQLEIFVAIARLGNVSLAAGQLGMSQSAASTALSEFERRSGSAVFDRAGRRLVLNEIGRALLPRAIEMLDRGGEIDALLDGRDGGVALRLGATLTIGDYLAPALIARYRTEHPAASIALSVGNTDTIATRAAHFELDIALIEGECTDPDLDVIDWRGDALTLFCAPDHPLAGGSWPIARLLQQRWVVREQGSGTRRRLDQAMAAHRRDWRIEIELGQFEAIKRFVGLGGTIGCLSRIALEDEFREGRLAEIRTPDLTLDRRLSIVLHRSKYRTDAIEAFIRLAQQSPGGGEPRA